MLSNHEIADNELLPPLHQPKIQYPFKAQRCGRFADDVPLRTLREMKHPVHAVKWNARWKLLFAHARKRKEP